MCSYCCVVFSLLPQSHEENPARLLSGGSSSRSLDPPPPLSLSLSLSLSRTLSLCFSCELLSSRLCELPGQMTDWESLTRERARASQRERGREGYTAREGGRGGREGRERGKREEGWSLVAGYSRIRFLLLCLHFLSSRPPPHLNLIHPLFPAILPCVYLSFSLPLFLFCTSCLFLLSLT